MQEFKSFEKTFAVLTTLFCVTLVLTNILAVKIFYVPFFNVALSGGDLLYPLSFLITDIVAEVYGKKRAGFIVLTGFFITFFMLAVTQFCLHLPPHPYWVAPGNVFGYRSTQDYQKAFSSVFSVGGLLVFASSTAYLVSQLLDITIFQKLKQYTEGRHLWLRNNGSTIISQFVDSVIFTTLYFFWGIGLELTQCLQLFLSMYGFKFFFALIDTPFCYAGVAIVRRFSKTTNKRGYQWRKSLLKGVRST